MKETFEINRFWKYFKYDLLTLYREHGIKIASTIALPCLLYISVGILKVLLGNGWYTDGSLLRTVTASILMAVTLVTLSSNVYGHLTDKKPAINWIMVPASSFEKFLSMALVMLVVFPIVLFGGYFILDGILCLLDPHSGSSLVSIIYQTGLFSQPSSEFGFSFSLFGKIASSVAGIWQLILIFLLGGIFFEKNKVAKTAITAVAVSMAISAIGLILIWAVNSVFEIDSIIDFFLEHDFKNMLSIILNTLLYCATFVPVAVLLAGIYIRIKTLKA